MKRNWEEEGRGIILSKRIKGRKGVGLGIILSKRRKGRKGVGLREICPSKSEKTRKVKQVRRGVRSPAR